MVCTQNIQHFCLSGNIVTDLTGSNNVAPSENDFVSARDKNASCECYIMSYLRWNKTDIGKYETYSFTAFEDSEQCTYCFNAAGMLELKFQTWLLRLLYILIKARIHSSFA